MPFSGVIDEFMKGMLVQKADKADGHFAKDVIDHLFDSGGSRGGLDLVAMNIQVWGVLNQWRYALMTDRIQRGRDHGLQGYTAYRQACVPARGKPASFADLAGPIRRRDVARLRRLYAHVDDVDLFVGGILERHRGGGILGPTFRCIVGDTFARLKLGDRFFYDLKVGKYFNDRLVYLKPR